MQAVAVAEVLAQEVLVDQAAAVQGLLQELAQQERRI
jgi:hypothetical protein